MNCSTNDDDKRLVANFLTLTFDTVFDCIHRVCEQANLQVQKKSCWTFQPASANDLHGAYGRHGSTKHTSTALHQSFDPNLLFGVVGKKNNKEDYAQLCTFYFAYSTWEGRVIFWDQTLPLATKSLDTTTDDDSNNADKLATERLWVRLVTRIGQALSCSRIVWRHEGTVPVYGAVPAETLEGWLTLHWDLAAMQAFAPFHATTSNGVRLSFQQAFASALEQGKHNQFRLRLASAADIDIIDRLVRGLAEFEHEPESYKLSKEQLKHDGFAGRPLYYCILMDDVATEESSTPYTFAMAFCYVGCDLSGGRFLYLEDLFVEKEYRGKGGGKLVMTTLALVAQSLLCTKAKWQALDWNTPALAFYDSLGARVQDGLITSRFAGEAMEKFAQLPLVDE